MSSAIGLSASDRHVQSAAYHEAGHTVIAAIQKMPLRNGGIHIDSCGSGISFYWSKRPGDEGTDIERERTIISTAAGWWAQIKAYPDCPFGAKDDYEKIDALLDEIHFDRSELWYSTKDRLLVESKRLVNQHWPAIEALSLALWGKPWTIREPDPEREWSTKPDEKWLAGSEVVATLQAFQVDAFIKDETEKYKPRLS